MAKDTADSNGDFGTREIGDYTDVFSYDLASNRMGKQEGWDDDGNGILDNGETVDETVSYSYNGENALLSEDSSNNAHDAQGNRM